MTISESKEVENFESEIEEFMTAAARGKCRLHIQSKSEGGNYNYTDIQNDLEIEDWEFENHRGNRILVINRGNLNNGQRIDLDLSATEDERIYICYESGEDASHSFTVGAISIWFDQHR